MRSRGYRNRIAPSPLCAHAHPGALRPLAAIVAAIIVLSGCVQPGPAGFGGTGVRVQGSVTAANPAATTRSLATAVTGIAGLPVVAGGLQIEAAVEAPVSEDDGGFQIDVEPEPDSQTLFLLVDEGAGVGMEQLAGYMELSATGDETQAGWPLADAPDGTLVDVGTLTDNGSGAYLPAVDSDAIAETLGADLAAVYADAYRDNYLKLASNYYLNRDARLRMWTNTTFGGTMDNARDRWSAPEDAVTPAEYSFGFNLERVSPEGLGWEDFADGSNVFEVRPPTTVDETSGLTFDENNPIRSNEYWPNGGDGDQINGLGFLGPPPDGLWYVSINGEVDSAWEIGVTNLYDESGQFRYFIPQLFVDVDDGTTEIVSVTLRFLAWDYEQQDYLVIDDAADMPFEFHMSYRAIDPYGSNPEIGGLFNPVLGTPLTFADVEELTGTEPQIYWDPVVDTYQMHAITVGYVLGYNVEINFWRTNETL